MKFPLTAVLFLEKSTILVKDNYFFLKIFKLYVSVMPVIRLKTCINAAIELVFDLSRSVDLHQLSTAQTGEKVVGGRKTGLIEMGESVSWEGRHLGVRQRLTSRITSFDRPDYFVDEMVRGAFKSFRHEHMFIQKGDFTIMTDIFSYEVPFGVLGRAANYLFLYNYMEDLLLKRNEVIKEYAENGQGAILIYEPE